MSMVNFTHPHDMVNTAQQTKRFGLRFAHPFPLWRKSMMLNATAERMKEALNHPACHAARNLDARADELLDAIGEVAAFKHKANHMLDKDYFDNVETMRRIVELVLSSIRAPISWDEVDSEIKGEM